MLLVDDDRVTRTVVAGLLKKCRYQGMWRILGVLKRNTHSHTTRNIPSSIWSDTSRVDVNNVSLADLPPPCTTVTSASSGREALALLERGIEFNLLLTDVMMPDVDGPALLHRVREDPDLFEMPVVMMSSNEHADVVLNCLRLGAEDYLLKPVTKKAVKHMWAHVWRRKQQNQMVPRFENGAEVLDDDEFENRMAAGDLQITSHDVDGVVTVPDPDEFSSDGETDDEMLDDDDETQRALARAHEREFVADLGRRGELLKQQPSTSFLDPRLPMSMVREGFKEGAMDCGNGGVGSRSHMPHMPRLNSDESMEEGGDDATMPDRSTSSLGELEQRRLADPLLIVDPSTSDTTTYLRRLQAMAPIEGLAEGKRTIRTWIDAQNSCNKEINRSDALHVLSGCASLLANAHDGGILLKAMRPSSLVVSPQGDVSLAPPRPVTPERAFEGNELPRGTTGRGGQNNKNNAKGARGRSRYVKDPDDQMESADDMTVDDTQDARVDAAASSSFFASAAKTVPVTTHRDTSSKTLKQNRDERHSAERLYVSPEEKAGSVPVGGAGVRAECFQLGVLMVEMCWPSVAAGARGDVGALLAATLRPDGAGAAELAKDPEESKIAKQLLQPVPGNRPSAAQTHALLRKVAESRAESYEELNANGGWRTTRDRGMASEKRRAELVALAGFLRANREARQREAQAHRVRSALLAHALRQLGGIGAEEAYRHGDVGAGSLRAPSRSQRERLASGGSFEKSRRGVSFDLGRANVGERPATLFTPGDAPPGEKPSKRRRAPGSNAAELENGLEKHVSDVADTEKSQKLQGSTPSPSSTSPPREASAKTFKDLQRPSFERRSLDAARRSADGGSRRVSRPPSRQTSFNEGHAGSLERTHSASGDARRPSLDRVKQLQASDPSGRSGFGSGLVARSFSAGDLSLLDAGDAAAAAAAAGHRPASELDSAAFEALEENFYESCARAVAPVARAYAHATRADAAAASDALNSTQNPNSTQSLTTSLSAKRTAVESAANAAGAALSDAFTHFGGELAQSVRKTNLKVIADVSHGDVHSFGEMICSVGWDRDGEYVATCGISKRLRIFETAAMCDSGAAVQCPVAETRVSSKLSSLAWNPYVKRLISFADYDGKISLFDANVGSTSYELCEHQKRVWSLDFSTLDPTLLASGSDDGTVKVWSTTTRNSTATIKCRANVCSVQFSPVNANVVAFSSAEHKTHVYDLRRTQRPLVVLQGHKKAVSYVKWLGAHQLVTASTDNTLKLWDVTKGFANNGDGGNSVDPCCRTFAGHVNHRNFVGLDVSKDGRIACGSEDNTVQLFSKSVPTPIAGVSLASSVFGGNRNPGKPAAEKPGLFISAVSWSPGGDRILAANSCGAVKVLELTHDES